MKILTRISLYYIAISLLVFSFGGFFFYIIFKSEIYEELDEQLRDEKRNIERLVASGDTMNLQYSGVNYSLDISSASDIKKIQKKDTIIFHPFEGELSFRQWRFQLAFGDEYKTVTIRKSLIDIEDLAEQIAIAMMYAYLAFIAISLAANYFILKRIFTPFYKTLKELQRYSINSMSELSFTKSNTTEFNQLNNVLNEMSKRLLSDYKNIKEFNENASHEIQTPLTIIRNKLELLMQNSELKEEEAELIGASYEATNRLSKLVQSLILLSKIENDEFKSSVPIDLSKLTERLLLQMKEEFSLKNIDVSLKCQEIFSAVIHPMLAEILIRNLFSNALKYTQEGGSIEVYCAQNKIEIRNSGSPLGFDPDRIFKRFFYAGNSNVSQGIGLSLAKKIADTFSIRLQYSYVAGFHTFTLSK